MIPRVVPAGLVVALYLLALAPVRAAEAPHDWLLRIGQAARRLNYEGTFVYQHGAQLETMRIAHRVANGVTEERLVSLTGTPREVIRTEREVRCYLPDSNSIVVEHRRANGQGFPAILPERLRDLEENYVLELGRGARVTGRPVQGLVIRPRDDFRYGYQLWADRETGLLLKADVINDKGKILEQFMFTQIAIGGDIPASAIAPQTKDAGMVWYRDAVSQPSAAPAWRATKLPPGFKLRSSVMRKMPMRDDAVQQLVYSDGLATVSVFIEPLNESGPPPTGDGPTRMGALYALGRPVDSHHVTVVGEVPAKTVAMIGASVVAEPVQ
ncbi:sigma E regulatory protein, MucB/RseB [Sulfurifustis variabilis]|uniref:Sigma E regulatory protein, MucB/RseB n=1 Tax=Sulfurifustis variabilis TaxID=1675686 RepID=A0A1B4V9P7_9GAMM|nr:MucB/RseB C-terminal domain-containing protein [Sulfurifustis variabilis]BAU48224.1 sigma E regulatory protein, MucB/RseB [Sulfurifustis variabilis]